MNIYRINSYCCVCVCVCENGHLWGPEPGNTLHLWGPIDLWGPFAGPHKYFALKRQKKPRTNVNWVSSFNYRTVLTIANAKVGHIMQKHSSKTTIFQRAPQVGESILKNNIRK